MGKPVVIHWFRQDLRLSDNPALSDAAGTGDVLPVYILDDANAGDLSMGAASRYWLHHSLRSLARSLGGKLCVYKGNPETILLELVQRKNIRAVYWNRCYEPWQVERDEQIRHALQDRDIEVRTENASLLWEPWDTLKDDGTPYRVFTPFYTRGCQKAVPPREPLSRPEPLRLVRDQASKTTVDDLGLLSAFGWHEKLAAHWTIGEQSAQQRLQSFIHDGLQGYKEGRDFPARANVSRLSPHLHFGEISPHQVRSLVGEASSGTTDLDHFLRELGWREFSYSLLYHCPNLPYKNLQPKFDAFAWRDDQEVLKCWQQGQTGYPIVDAGMRELWQTGYMHNRVRMIVGSFLVKNLLLHWRHGERWFWDCLVDADLANNSASWQWIAGCGADAAPYFRIFNPVTQGRKFDPAGDYTRHYVQELSGLPVKYLFNPWDAPPAILKEANIKLGKTYPVPVVDLAYSRERALKTFARMRQAVQHEASDAAP